MSKLLNYRIFISGHNGMLGSSVLRILNKKKFKNILFINKSKLDLRKEKSVENYILKHKPEIIINCASVVGGIQINTKEPVKFLNDNVKISSNLINAAFKYKVKYFINLGATCMYPKNSKQPMDVDDIFNGLPELTNEAYALSKIFALKLCQFYNSQYNKNFVTIIPPNAYGPNDDFNIKSGHVISNLINKFHLAKINSLNEVKVWGSGLQKREFIYVDDIASSIYFIIKNINNSKYNIFSSQKKYFNIGSGEEISIRNLSHMIANIVDYKGKILFDKSMPDGNKRRLLNSKYFQSKGWKAKIKLEEGLALTYKWYLKNVIK